MNHRIPASVYDELKRRKPVGRAPAQHLQYAANNLRRVCDAGILVVAGTDTTVPGVLLGISSQMELVILVQDGLTPLEALRTATLNAARMLGREADFGTVDSGKIADLVVLRQNPLADIANITTINLVLKGGRVHQAAEWQNKEWRSL